MKILIIDQCSGTKSHPDTHPVVDQDETIRDSRDKILCRLDIDGIQASDLYDGKQQRRISDAVRILENNGHSVTRYFISAGFGLVKSDELLPPYEATFNDMSKEEATQRSEAFKLTERVQGATKQAFDLIFFALGSDYYDAFELGPVLDSIDSDTGVILFNQEEVEGQYDNVISIPARTPEGKEFGSTVVGLKGTYIKNFAAAVGDEEMVLAATAAKHCQTDPHGNQSGIDNYV